MEKLGSNKIRKKIYKKKIKFDENSIKLKLQICLKSTFFKKNKINVLMCQCVKVSMCQNVVLNTG